MASPEFLTDLKCELVSSGWWRREWKLTAPLTYRTLVLGKPRLIEVPEGFVTDFASVPRVPIVWWWVGAIGQRPAVIHDYIYTYRKFSREVADRIFREALQVVGVNQVNRNIMYAGVRVGGYWAYNK